MIKNKHTDLDGLIDLDSRSLIKLGNSAVVSIPSAEDLGIIVDILPALKREDSSVEGSCALLWDFREGIVSPTSRGRPTRIARAVPSA